jgi:hypothetical protein
MYALFQQRGMLLLMIYLLKAPIAFSGCEALKMFNECGSADAE